jgi:starch synthase
LVKTGGLGDVSAALPAALRALGTDVRVLLPGYPAVLAANPRATELARLTVLGHEVRLLDGVLPGGVRLLVLECAPLFERGGGPYQADDGDDWDDNALRFGVLSRVAAILGSTESPIDWRPEVVHCNDWPAALAPAYLRFMPTRSAASLTTIHNLAFQGVCDFPKAESLGLAAQVLGHDGGEFFGRFSFLKAGLVYSDAINTVSPTYAHEIQGEALGFGMDGVLRARRDRLFGVLNGIDTDLWNPQADAWIASRYGPLTLEKKRDNKLALKQRMGLAGDNNLPLLGMVTRLTHQKGIDLLTQAAHALVQLPAQIVVVGTGDRDVVHNLQTVCARHKESFALYIGFDEGLAHMVEAGADIFLMPSRFEPCGMNQMYSQRYGTPPVVNATGGLVDTVIDETRAVDARPTGFLMSDATPEALLEAVDRAVTAYRDPKRWRTLQLNGMSRDFGWDRSAREYLEIYGRIVAPAKAGAQLGSGPSPR